MVRSNAQKEADKRYAQKIAGKYKPFIVNLKPEELEKMDNIIREAGMTKADFLRWAIEKLASENARCQAGVNTDAEY